MTTEPITATRLAEPAPRKRRVPLAVWIAGPLLVAAIFGWEWYAGTRHVGTDNAYVKAERVLVSGQVAGRVVEVAVGQNQAVKAGDLLYRIDPQPLQLALAQAEARLAQVADRAGAGRAGSALAQLPEYQAALAERDQARLDLQHAEVRAPVAGVVGGHDLQVGEYLALGQVAMPLVATAPVWIEANFKETDLARLRVGQAAQVRIDSYPHQHWPARVASISPASGSEFSVLPAQNASGNWVKVVQRIPVRFELIGAPTDAPVLRAGMSAEVDVDLHDAPKAATTAKR